MSDADVETGSEPSAPPQAPSAAAPLPDPEPSRKPRKTKPPKEPHGWRVLKYELVGEPAAAPRKKRT